METVIDNATQKNIESWLSGDYDRETKEEIRRLQRENPQELIDAFYTTLSFGTGGLRGIVGVGTNRMNAYNIRAATQGLANYIKTQTPKGEKHAVVIGYDCRNHSRAFSEEAAKVLAANGIEVFLFSALRPVALVSFGVLYKKATAGIMVTASHNPPEYNGYKVYWDYGGQVLPPHDKGIIDEVERITSTEMVKKAPLPHPLVHEVNDEIDQAYLRAIHEWQLHPGDNHTHGKELHVVYTSLHGAGITMIPPALSDWGFTNLTIVKEQEAPDGNFPTVKSPNPEEHAALEMGIEELKRVKGDLLLGTDPDTDRLGVVVMHQNKPFFFNGNELACILLEHICRALHQTQSMPPKPMFIKTIVTTELFRKIAEHYEGRCLDVLTGFKYIGEKIAQWEEEKGSGVARHHYIFGGEESYGYLLGTHARDKDAIISAACVCEAALQLKREGKTLVDFLYEIYNTYGIFREKLLSLTFEGKEGADKMKSMMRHLRDHPPKILAGTPVAVMEDYLTHTKIHPETGEKEALLLPKSDVLRFWLEDGTKIVVRPSGTEPKIKLYCAIQERHHHVDRHDMEKAIAASDRRLDELLLQVKKKLLS
ncbi:MAG: phospho-sugar mutase [Chlamydiales bacterium]|nr:phospho-sugar mutase [Chlamydiales bacterium]